MISNFRPVNQQVLPISHYLDEQDKLLDEIQAVLVREFNCIKDRKLEFLESIAEKKSAIMLKLQQNDQKLKLHPQSKSLKEEYQQRVAAIKSKLQMCQRINDTNGKLINSCIASNRRLSSLLMVSRDKDTKNMTYTEKGGTVAKGLARLNIEA